MITKSNAVYKQEVTLAKENGYSLTVTETFVNQDHFGQNSEETISRTYAVIGWEVGGSCEPDYVEIFFNVENDEGADNTFEIYISLEDLIDTINK